MILLLYSCSVLQIQEEEDEYGIFSGNLLLIDENEVLAVGRARSLDKLVYFPKKVEYKMSFVDSLLISRVKKYVNLDWNFIFCIDTICDGEVYINIITEN